MSETGGAKDGEEKQQYETPAIDWGSLLDAANDPELAELLQSPIDNAISILKTGREIQKLSVIRTLSDLLESDGDQVVEKVMPLVQQMLDEECSNLDVQCEAAVTFKNIYRNSKLTARVPGISDVILNGILQNAAQQKDNLTAAAWLETLVEVIEQTPLSQLKQLVVPLAVSQAETSQRAQRRVLATKLVEKLCAVLQPIDIRRDIMPCVQMLCSDPNSNVRSSIAQRLGGIAESLRNPSDCASVLVPCLVELCRDTEVGTREAALNTVAQCMPFLSKENRKNSIIPLLKRCTEEAIIAQNEALSVVARNLGQWMYLLKDVVTARDNSWFLDTYVRIASLARGTSTSSGTPSNVQLAARRMCAYNFPCIVLAYGGDCFKDRLLPILESFCSDPDDDVRSATAAGFHEVVKLVPNEPALIPPFIELIRGSAAEVVGHLTGSLDRILPALYKCVSEQNNSKINRVQLDRIIIGCNRLIRGTSSWRAQHSYLQNIAVLRHLIPVKDLFISFVPMLKQEVLTTRAIPCRIAASITLLLFMRENPNKAARQSIIDFFINSVATHPNCHRRRLFLDIIPEVTANFSRKFFHTHFLDAALQMANDQVANIRPKLLCARTKFIYSNNPKRFDVIRQLQLAEHWLKLGLQLCHTLSKIKANLYLPQDEEILRRLEGIVRELLSKEQNSSTRQLIQTYACELSRVETRSKSDKSDQLKEKAEKEIWSRKVTEPTVEVIEAGSLQSNDGQSDQAGISGKEVGRLDAGPWRIQHPKMAIVRPQPHVVVTQRSPSPMPRSFSAAAEERNSKLPLATSPNNRPLSAQRRVSAAAIKTPTTRPMLPVAPRRSSMEVSTKTRPPLGHSNTITSTTKSLTTVTANKPPVPSVTTRRSSATSIMTRSVPSSAGLLPSRSTSSVRPLGQGLIKVRSFSNIARTPAHLSMKVKTIN